MIRITGIILLLIMSVCTGWLAAGNLKKRVRALRQLRAMLEEIRILIRYEAAEVSEIIRRICNSSGFEELLFLNALSDCGDRLCAYDGETFSDLWNKALSERPGSFSEEDLELIGRIGSCLGTCDCEGQLSALSLLMVQTDKLITEAEEQYNAKGRLYRSLGAVAGALIAVLVV